jgi:hypothetical protein
MIAERRFVLGASQKRVWDLLAMVIFQQLPLERVDIVGLDSFNAVLRWGVGFIKVPFRVEGKLVDVAKPTSYGCLITVKRGPVRLGVRVGIAVKAVDENKSEVICTAMEEEKGTLLGRLLSGQQRAFALKTFDSIGGRLEELCS